MGSMSIWHWLVVAVIVLLLFGRGKISELMGDVAGGIKAFKKGMAEDDDAAKKAEEEKARLEAAAKTTADAAASTASSTKPN
ncbi:MAG: twin-arginine translocase TatA/TatE family subunit [Methylocystis sp.]|nr:twin-arginine translocase TatA/TatE family subunit [Methylocystis sp.]MCA3584034.1 twin-arginine translocase TatA/TatE family subunit [Methylocystis sp.]MCA3586678.1 twin-arginine translocase TatA/TatE family subunit [Methylocystis sp.]MCA3591648.1 twin-arginine translocase TatA/TatE family subunit [Methylocystis sp.]